MRDARGLEQTLLELHKRFGHQAVVTLAEYSTAPPPVISSGFPALDALLGVGGLACGRITAFCGRASAGRTTLVQQIAAHAQREVDLVAYLDLAKTFDSESAARCGIDPERLLVVQFDAPRLLPELVAALVALRIRLIVLDASAAKLPVDFPPWLTAELARGSSALLLLHPIGQTPTSDHAAVRLLVEPTEGLQGHPQIGGCQARITVLESRFSPPGAQATLNLWPEGR